MEEQACFNFFKSHRANLKFSWAHFPGYYKNDIKKYVVPCYDEQEWCTTNNNSSNSSDDDDTQPKIFCFKVTLQGKCEPGLFEKLEEIFKSLQQNNQILQLNASKGTEIIFRGPLIDVKKEFKTLVQETEKKNNENLAKYDALIEQLEEVADFNSNSIKPNIIPMNNDWYEWNYDKVEYRNAMFLGFCDVNTHFFTFLYYQDFIDPNFAKWFLELA